MMDLDRKYLELKEKYLAPKRAETSGPPDPPRTTPDPDKRRKQKDVKKKTAGPPDHPPTVLNLDKGHQHKDLKRNIA
ncbi:hypothetical protein TNIN_95321 [Trichonephila inaurata madagascariensis]|uniref:Uncharacterized protein n=1 Tax=Trichonephila inaurata madagascariensis TaxID=2747483 RepID=A0A8X6YZJ3_9ARAC|nr:hypothetical protein TNIN_95321 [Trichonephila inaurata madagascariensis]